MIRLAAALVAALLLFTTSKPQGWATAEAAGVEKDAADLVPVLPRERVLVVIPGSGAETGSTPSCLQCRCCSRPCPGKCEVTNCCSTFNCDPAGKCNLVLLLRCDCNSCGGD